MLELKQRRDIGWDDMARIEDPFFAKTEIEHRFYQTDDVDDIWGLPDIHGMHTYSSSKRDDAALQQILTGLMQGQFF
jgi:hypothetical protein